jgi:hypothetical protein
MGVAIQASDLGVNRDSVTVLSGLGSALAARFARALGQLERRDDGMLGDGTPRNPAQIGEFVQACRRELAVTSLALRARLDRTGLLDCLTVAALFGHHGPGGFDVVNAFTYEMELLASAVDRVGEPWAPTRHSLAAALDALGLARRIEVLHRHLAYFPAQAGPAQAGQQWQVHHQLAAGSASLGSAFATQYDWEYSRRLAEQIRRRGGTHPDLDVLFTLFRFLMGHRFDLVTRFRDEITEADDALGGVLRDGTLLHLPPGMTLTGRAGKILTRYARRVAVPWSAALAAVPEHLRAEAAQWRDILAVQPGTLGRNPDFRRTFASPLAFSPLVPSGDSVLLALPHALSTNLSRLLERVFTTRRVLPYYRARGEAVEREAIRHLGAVFTGAQVLRGGTYPGARPGELVEVDGVLRWHDVALVVEGKGGYLSRRARTGDPVAATAELRRTVGDGFFQAARLVRALEREQEVTLTDARGQSLTLDARTLRRVYVVVPTADTFDPISTTLDLLWRQQILADGAIPLIISVQELNLLTDLLPAPLELLGYLDYREEILADPALRIAGELEILGCYTGNLDVVGDVERARARHGVQPVAIGTDHQQRFIDPWLAAAGDAWVRQIPAPAPPRRHTAAERARIDRLHTGTGSTEAAVLAHQFDRAHLGAAVLLAEEAPRPRRGVPLHYRCRDLGVVVVSPPDPIRSVRRLPDVRALRAVSRTMAYLSPGPAGPVLRHVERGGKHRFATPAGSLAGRSRLGALDQWFDAAARRRHKAAGKPTPADEENIGTLVEAGMRDTLALGITRLGLTRQVLGLADGESGISLNQAADLYLTHVRQAATHLGIHPADLALPAGSARAVARLVHNGRIRAGNAALLLRLVVRDPGSPPEELARAGGLLTEDGFQLEDAVRESLAPWGLTLDDVRGMTAKNRRRTRDRLLGAIRARYPAANLNAAAALVDRLLSAQR